MDSNGKREELSGKKNLSALRNNVYNRLDPTLQAECIYFYYLKVSPNPKEATRVFFVDRGRHIPWNSMEAEMGQILADITNGALTPCGWNLGDLKWRRRSYIAVVLEHPTHRLEQSNAVEFSLGHAFRDGKDVPSFPAPYANVSGFYCLNHMIDRFGNPLRNSEQIEVTAHHPHHFAARLAGTPDHTDTGTNMGPPIGPP